jgi:hypothetical protein
VEGFNLKKLHDVEFKEQYQIKIWNKFAALGNFHVNVDNSRAWESIRGYVKASTTKSLGYYEVEQHE